MAAFDGICLTAPLGLLSVSLNGAIEYARSKLDGEGNKRSRI